MDWFVGTHEVEYVAQARGGLEDLLVDSDCMRLAGHGIAPPRSRGRNMETMGGKSPYKGLANTLMRLS